MLAVFGLGNPGRKYQNSRHNIGFITLDYIQNQFKVPFLPGKGDYYFAEISIAGEGILLIKPYTFMNHSGRAVVQALERFSLDIEDILIVYDDFNLPFGTLRFRKRGSDGGHNGIKSILYHLETQTFDRLKIGIGDTFENSVEFVLTPFSEDEQKQIKLLVEQAYQGIRTWIREGIDQAMNDYNRNIIEN